MISVRLLYLLILGFSLNSDAATLADPSTARRPGLDELIGEPNIQDVDVSPSGRYVAAILRAGETDTILIVDLQTNSRTFVLKAGRDVAGIKTEAHMTAIYWKSDDRLLFRTRVEIEEDRSTYSSRIIRRLGDRVFAVNRDGSEVVRLLATIDEGNARLFGSLNLGNIASFLRDDPNHVIMTVNGQRGPGLFRVDVRTGVGTLLEPPVPRVIQWWLDAEGRPTVRIEQARGLRTYHRRSGDEWIQFHQIRVKELDLVQDFDLVGPSEKPGTAYVIARPAERDRRGVYLYEYESGTFGEPLVEHERFDITFAVPSRDGKRLNWYCYVEHVLICSSTDPSIDDHLKGIRRHFANEANVRVIDMSDDRSLWIILVDGPSRAPAYYLYRTAQNDIILFGFRRSIQENLSLPAGSVVEWKARDGLQLTGYLTRPRQTDSRERLPLVLLPHGGPESRDMLQFNREVQFYVAQGFAVFQPNYRGSDGYGRKFAELGYRQWGLKMQEDLEDGVGAIVDRGLVDPKRVCIVGGSYGGFAALAGVARKPNPYRCAVATNGAFDLGAFVRWRKHEWGSESEGYTYWLDSIGDPRTDSERMAATSPVNLASSINVPVLLIHGENDGIVPIAQSKMMKRALDKAGNPTRLMSFKGEGHSYWSDESERERLDAIGRFLTEHLGPRDSGPSL